MTDSPVTTPAAVPSSRRRTPRWLSTGIAILFGLFYAYDIWEGVGNLVGLNILARSLDTQLSGLGIFVLLVGILGPLLVFVLAAWIGRSRGPAAQVALLLAGLGLNAAIAANIFTLGAGSLLA
ncbi:hypothetical protein E3O53_03990 [Cryobacterium sp. TMT2-18-3]|uniref:hypothetical protein n=1 Tax=unclassified Cryobacterium TaxID=2649013 RepID=UPI001068EF30|nr:MULTISPECIES: hypothetical protein [unclassified Cryobacterium]TFC29046.1 hypothetical protein E3O22_07865 [Cryobacterium sp. TMT2-18-2]TFC38532.1 hypothetical protein E3O18_02955 [Cryobacterium sp. TMT2-42-4]TFC66340.1 hypothetical protein E3O53_03990 [Cryobacterium sp. TMT2-18-3]